MNKVLSLNYPAIIKALKRDGWTIVGQRGSHIRLHKHVDDEVLKLTVPAHKPVKRSTLSHILKQAHLTVFRDKTSLASSGYGTAVVTIQPPIVLPSLASGFRQSMPTFRGGG